MSISQYFNAVDAPPPVVPPSPLFIADYLRYYEFRVNASTYRPYEDVAEACATVPLEVRAYRTVNVAGVEYWWTNDVSDGGLQVKVQEGNSVPVLPNSRIHWVQGAGQVPSFADGTKDRPFTTVMQAHNVSSPGDIIRVLPGGTAQDAFGRPCYSETTILTRDVCVVIDPGVVFTGVWNCGNFGSSQPFNIRIFGGEWLSELSMIRQQFGASTLQVDDARFTGLGYFLAFGRPFGGNYYDEATLRNCYFNSLQDASTSGPVQIFGRDDMQQSQQVVLDSCLVISQNAACATFGGNPLSRLILRGATEFRALSGQPVFKSVAVAPSNNVYPSSTWLLDERPVAAGSEDPRKNLSTDNIRGRTVNIDREGKYHLSSIALRENIDSIGFQVIQNNAAIAPARTGSPSAVATAINTDIDGMSDYTFYTIRTITVPTVSGNRSVALVTVLPA